MGWNFVSFHAEPDNDYLYAQKPQLLHGRTDNWDRPMYAGNYEGREGVLFSTEIEQYNLEGNQPQPIFPGYQESTFMIGAQLMEAYLGEKSPEEALAQAEADGNAVLDRNPPAIWPLGTCSLVGRTFVCSWGCRADYLLCTPFFCPGR